MTEIDPAFGPGMEDLLKLHDRVRSYVACPLHETRTQAVPGYGPASARILAIGEAPGEKEDKEGKPFIGAAGKLLTKLLSPSGFRGEICISPIP